VCRHLIALQDFPPRLRQLVIKSVELIGPQGFEGVEVKKIFELLNQLHVSVGDMNVKHQWADLLTSIIQHPDEVQHLSQPYWELLVELSLSGSVKPGHITYNSDIVKYLEDHQEWGKLECWMGIMWMAWPLESDAAPEGDLGRASITFFHQRPSAIPKLEQWIEQWSASHCMGMLEIEPIQRKNFRCGRLIHLEKIPTL